MTVSKGCGKGAGVSGLSPESALVRYENNQPHSDDSHPVTLPSHDSSAGAGCGFGLIAAGGAGATAGCADGVGAGAGVIDDGAGGMTAVPDTCGADEGVETGAFEGEFIAEEWSGGSGVTVATRRELPPAVSAACEIRSMSPTSGTCPRSRLQ